MQLALMGISYNHHRAHLTDSVLSVSRPYIRTVYYYTVLAIEGGVSENRCLANSIHGMNQF